MTFGEDKCTYQQVEKESSSKTLKTLKWTTLPSNRLKTVTHTYLGIEEHIS